MLKLKIFANEALQMPETICEGRTTVELLDPYLLQSPVVGGYKIIYGRLRRAARYTGIPMWGIQKNKALQSSAYLADALVRHGLGEWIEFNESEFNPATALSAVRNTHTAETRKQAHATRRETLALMSPEEKAAWGEAIREGHARKKKQLTEEEIEKLKQERRAKRLAKKLEKAIAEGRVPASADEVPDWFKFSKS